MSVETDLTALLREHRMCSVSIWVEGPERHYCSCRKWSSTANAHLHGHDEFVVHLASVVSAAYTLTPKADPT